MRKFLIALLSLALTSSVGAQSCCDFDTPKDLDGESSFWWPGVPTGSLNDMTASNNGFTMDAAAEKMAWIGQLHINGATSTSTSKTCSTSGCSIAFLPGAATWANASTSITIGVDTVATGTGSPTVPADETMNVSGTCLQSGCTITASTWKSIAMDAGSLSMTHGTYYALMIDMTARGGADSLTVHSFGVNVNSSIPHMPAGVHKTGGTWAQFATDNWPNMLITFDDGTLGWLEGSMIASSALSGTNFNSGSTPDERAMIFKAPCTCYVDAVMFAGGPQSGSSADYEVDFYADPLVASPSLLNSIAVDANQHGANTNKLNMRAFSSRIPIFKNRTYGVSLRPTTANNIGLQGHTVSAVGVWDSWAGGQNAYLGTRSDNAGAFSATTTSRPSIWIRISNIRSQ